MTDLWCHGRSRDPLRWMMLVLLALLEVLMQLDVVLLLLLLLLLLHLLPVEVVRSEEVLVTKTSRATG